MVQYTLQGLTWYARARTAPTLTDMACGARWSQVSLAAGTSGQVLKKGEQAHRCTGVERVYNSLKSPTPQQPDIDCKCTNDG
jgi:hypothetical protein